MYVYVCMYVCMYIYAHIHTCMHACMHAYIQTYRHIYTQIYVCASALMLLSCMDFCPAIFVFSRSRLKNSCVRSRRFQTSDVGFGIPIQRCKSSRRAGGGGRCGCCGLGVADFPKGRERAFGQEGFRNRHLRKADTISHHFR